MATRCPECKVHVIRQVYPGEETSNWFELEMYAVGLTVFALGYIVGQSTIWSCVAGMVAAAGYAASTLIRAYWKIPEDWRRWELASRPPSR